MQNMWISVVLIVLVIVVGLIAGTRLSTPGPQRRAVFSAFGALAVLAIWFFVFIAFFPADWIVPFFTVACIVIPICIYMGVARGKHDRSMKIPKAKSVDTIKAEQPLGPKPPTPEQVAAKQSKPSMAAGTTAQPAKTQGVPASKPAQSARTTAPTPSQTPAAASKSAQAPVPTSAAAPKKAPEAPKAKPETKPAEQPKATPKVQQATQEAKTTSQQQKAEPAKRSTTEDAPKAAPVAAETKQPTPASAPTPTPAPQLSAEQSTAKDLEKDLISNTKPTAYEAVDPKIAAAADMDILVSKVVAEEIDELEELVKPFGNAPQPTTPTDGPDLNIGSPLAEDATKAESASSATTIPAPRPTSAPKQPEKSVEKPIEKKPADPYTEFNARAAALRDQGAYAIAALLYEEAAAIAPNANASREAQFDELSCYVKAGDAKKAKEIAAKLRQSSVLTRFERIKLDAVERMS